MKNEGIYGLTPFTFDEKTNRTKAAAKQALSSVKEQTDALVETILSAGKAASAAGAPAPNNSKEKPKQPPMATRPPVPQPQAENPSPAGKALAAQPMSAAEFRAEFKAQQVKRLMAQASRQNLGVISSKLLLRGPSPLPLSHRMGEGENYCGGHNPGRRSFLACWAGMCHPFRVSDSGRMAAVWASGLREGVGPRKMSPPVLTMAL